MTDVPDDPSPKRMKINNVLKAKNTM